MNEKKNYGIILENTLKEIKSTHNKPKLMLHACCAPCSSYVLEYLNTFFEIAIFYYNPNISPKKEFDFRFLEEERLIKEMGLNVNLIRGEYEPQKFFDLAKGLENLPEDSERCYKCYRLRLSETARIAKKLNYDYFCTTLSISPHKNAQKLNEIGKKISEEFDIEYLYSDFKKKNGYKRSCELSTVYNLYRQNYCGCIYSKNNALPKSSNGNEKDL